MGGDGGVQKKLIDTCEYAGTLQSLGLSTWGTNLTRKNRFSIKTITRIDKQLFVNKIIRFVFDVFLFHSLAYLFTYPY